MPRNEAPPFPRGTTGTFLSDPSTADTTKGAYLEGYEWEFEDLDLSVTTPGAVPERSGAKVKCRVVRAKETILPKQVLKGSVAGTTPGNYTGWVNVAGAGDKPLGVADEFLPAAGVVAGDLFWMVVEGPSRITSASGGSTNFAIGQAVVTAATGTIVTEDTTQTGAGVFTQVNAFVGAAMEAINAVSTDVTVYVKPRRS